MSKSLYDFTNEIIKLPIRVGSITPAQQQFLFTFLNTNREIKTVLETGFHIGLSAATIMDVRTDITTISFDIFWFDYTRKAKLILDKYYPGRNLLLAGNSVINIPQFFNCFSNYKPDLVFIDGGHERPVPFLDMHIIFNNIVAGTWIIIDDYCEEHGCHGVNEAVDEYIKNNIIEVCNIFKHDDRGWILAKRTSIPVPYSPLREEANMLNLLKDIESHYS